MDELCDLLFEFSNEERLKILYELEKGPKNLSSIAKDLDFTSQGTSRNMARLVETSIIRRNPDGEYELTQYGSVTLKLLNSYEFLSRNKQYFLNHDASILPYHFINRLGELSASTFQGDFITSIAYGEAMMKAAEEYVYTIGEQFHVNAPPIIGEKIKLGVVFRTILPETVVPPPGFRPAASGVERRTLPKVKIRIFMNDKEAMFGFPTLEGKIDYTTFVSKDAKFRGWCLDLFKYFWDQGKPFVGTISKHS